jgi:hypothetical protein
MTFDELWRLNLARQQRPDDLAKEQESAGADGAPVASSDELNLTAQDCEFLSHVGISP